MESKSFEKTMSYGTTILITWRNLPRLQIKRGEEVWRIPKEAPVSRLHYSQGSSIKKWPS